MKRPKLEIFLQDGTKETHADDGGGRICLCFSESYLALFDSANFCFYKRPLIEIKGMRVRTAEGQFSIGRRVKREHQKLFSEVRKLCDLITGSKPDTPVKGEIESMALWIGHSPEILRANR